jgi:hypothetical protein
LNEFILTASMYGAGMGVLIFIVGLVMGYRMGRKNTLSKKDP